MSITLKLLCVLIVCGLVRISAARFGNRVAGCLLGFPIMTSLLMAVNLHGLKSAQVQKLAEDGVAGLMAATVLATSLAILALQSRNALVIWSHSLIAYFFVVASTHWTDLLPFWLVAVVATMLLVICGIVLCHYPVVESPLSGQRRGVAGYLMLLLPGILVVAGECVQSFGWPQLVAMVATFPSITCTQIALCRAAEGANGALQLVRRLPFTNFSTLAFLLTLRISVSASSMGIEFAFVLSLFAAAITLTGVVGAIDSCSRMCRTTNP